MASQTDLDQGGTFRQFVRRWLGPSVGWQWVPEDNVLAITAAGSYTAASGTTLVTVNVAGAVTLILPLAAKPSVNAMTQPGGYFALPITIVDIGGNALANNITIQPQGSETIMGLASIALVVDYGSISLFPDINASPGKWLQGSAP